MSGERERCRQAESLGAYVLGAVDAAERRQLEAHLEACEDCRAEATRLGAAAQLLPLSAPPLSPPPGLRRRLLEIVAKEAGSRSSQTARRGATTHPRRGSRLRRLFPRPGVTVALSCTALLAGVAGGMLLVLGGDDRRDSRILNARITDPALVGSATASVHVDGGRARLVVRGLPDLGPDRVYQVWVKPAARAPIAAGVTFELVSGTVEIPRRVESGDAVLVTSEPDGGSVAPTRPPLIVGPAI